MPLKAVFFDLDGTLIDTAPDFVVTLNELADEYQVERVTPEKIRQTVSDGARALTTLLFGLQENEPGFQERRLRLLEIYYRHMGKHSELFDGMLDLLQNFNEHKLTWGVITNKPLRFAQPIMEKLEFPAPPAVLICPDHVSNTKPDPEPLFQACEQIACQPQEVIYIGDHRRDIDCGLNAGCETIAVSFGYVNQEDNIHEWQAHYIVNHGSEIWPILKTKI